MAVRGTGIVVAMIALSAFWAGVAAQSSCTTALVSLSPCLSYIMGNSSTPTPTCCSQLANVVASQPRCLCMVLDREAAASLGITINQTLALALPSACQVQTPPVSACKAAADAPSSPPADSPMGPQAPIPSQGRESSDANLTTLTSSSILSSLSSSLHHMLQVLPASELLLGRLLCRYIYTCELYLNIPSVSVNTAEIHFLFALIHPAKIVKQTTLINKMEGTLSSKLTRQH